MRDLFRRLTVACVQRGRATVYVVRITYQHPRRVRLVTGADGRARVWFDRSAAEAYVRRQR